MYPLWDSRIYQILRDSKSKYAVSSTEKYIQYIKNCKELKKDKKIMNEIRKKVETHLRENKKPKTNEKLSDYRKIDIYMLECNPKTEILNTLRKGIKK
jgi:geranylgeranyl pyrophosphate synthase